MTRSLGQRLTDAVAGTELENRLANVAVPFLERRSNDAAATRLEGRSLSGLARALASQPPMAGFLSHRPQLLERIADANGATLESRARQLEASPTCNSFSDLEQELDALRIMRHEETCLVACLDLGGVVRFEGVSSFLSVLAETITRRALSLALASTRNRKAADELSIIGMGKIAGREFTFHSDLDLILLFSGAPDSAAEHARIGRRLISYLNTMTGAGIAYAVDTRLRPSGGQGVLVASFDRFEHYQLESAETWEHMALLRARAIAGNVTTAQSKLDHTRTQILARASEPWQYIADLRDRVEAERSRAADHEICLKTGAGGLMDVDFLAAGGLLEACSQWLPLLPSVPSMLKTVGQGKQIADLLADYRLVRLVESRARWIAGRAVERLDTRADGLATLAELVEPGTEPNALLEKLTVAMARIRGAYESVIRARTIDAISS